MVGHVAVVDDEPFMRDLITASLEDRYQVSSYGSIAEARDALQEHPPDLLIVDMQLGHECGLDLVGTIGGVRGMKVPTIMLSARNEEQDFTRAFAAGAADYMTKPFGREELLARCAKHLARAQESQPGTTSLEAELSLASGLTFGRYRIERELGRGGFGRVYLARDAQRQDELVALKVLAPAGGDAQEARLRFIRETYALASVAAPHTVSVLDVGAFQGQPYFAMSFIEGEGLGERVKRAGCLDEAGARAVARGLLRALQALEGAGILHRDMKPENVILRDGNVEDPVLIDFGLAKHALDRGVTAPDMLIGTAGYLSPEVILGKDADNRSDLFSLGLTLRNALTGEDVFAKLEGVLLLGAIASGPIPEAGCALSPGFRRFLMKLLEVEPSRRYASAASALVALEATESLVLAA